MRVLVLGMCPLPFENEKKLFGPGVRTWQFALPLLEDGHDVCLICSRIPFIYSSSMPAASKNVSGKLTTYSLSQAKFENRSFIQDLHDDFRPDCIVGATGFPSYIASLIHSEAPLWVDLFGHLMAEAQAKALVYDNDDYLFHFWRYEKTVVERGDAFSTVSLPQKYALIGELGARGRLNKRSAGYEFAHVIPCAMEPDQYVHDKVMFRGSFAAPEDFVVLWSGGFNTWVDVDTMFRALEMAMAENRRIKFVATGGQIDGHDDLTYQRFLGLVSRSRFKDRFLLKGWVPHEDVQNYYFEGDVGINVDKFLYEGMLGSKNRILDWSRAALPAVTTELCELSQMIRQYDLGFVCPVGDVSVLSHLILGLAENKAATKAAGERAKTYFFRYFSFQESTGPLRRWVSDPRRAPDVDARAHLEAMDQPSEGGSAGSAFQQIGEIRKHYEAGGIRGVLRRVRQFAHTRSQRGA